MLHPDTKTMINEDSFNIPAQGGAAKAPNLNEVSPNKFVSCCGGKEDAMVESQVLASIRKHTPFTMVNCPHSRP